MMSVKKNGAPPKEVLMYRRFRDALLAKFPNMFWYKIPDTLGTGGMRPFDAVAIIEGHTFCLEFKRGNKRTATEYQQYHLDLAAANGAKSFLINENNRSAILKTLVEIVKRKEP